MALLDQLLRAGGVSPAQIQRALETVGTTLLQQGNQTGREILRRVNPQLERAVDTTRQQGASRAIRQFEQNQAGRRAAEAGRPAPVPQFGGGGRPPARPTTAGGSGANRPPNPPRASASPEPTPSPRSTVYQPPLPNPRGPRGQYQSIYGEPRSVIEARLRRAVPVEQPPATGPAVSPGQLAFDALGLQEPMGPLSRQLLESDPQTYKSISDLAVAAQRQFNVPVTVEDLVGPRGTSLLNELQASSGIVRSSGGRAAGSLSAPRVEVTLDPDPSDIVRRGSLQGVSLYPEASDVIQTSTGAYQLPPGGVKGLRGFGPTANAVGAVGEDVVDIGPVVGSLSDATDFRNAVGGLRQRNLGRYVMPGSLGLAGGLGAGALGYFALREDQPPAGQRLTDAQLYPPQGSALPLTPDGGPNAYPPAAFDQGLGSGQTQTATTGQMGAGTVTIRMNDSASNQRQAAQNAAAGAGMFEPRPQDFRTPREFYTAAAAYARQPGVRENIAEQLAQRSERMGQVDMQAWVRSNPDLAYQLSLRNAPRDISQQTPNIQEGAVVTPLGENNANNMIGNTAEAVRVAEGAPSDIRDATDPRLAVSLKPMPKDLQAFFNRPGFAGTSRLY